MNNRMEAVVTSYTRGLEARGEVLAGAGEVLKDVTLNRFRMGSADQALRWLVEQLDGPAGARFLNPEYRPAEPEAPTRSLLRRFEAGGLFAKGKADELHNAWAASLMSLLGSAPGPLASAIVARITDPANESHLRERREPEAPGPDRAALRDHFREIGAGLM